MLRSLLPPVLALLLAPALAEAAPRQHDGQASRNEVRAQRDDRGGDKPSSRKSRGGGKRSDSRSSGSDSRSSDDNSRPEADRPAPYGDDDTDARNQPRPGDTEPSHPDARDSRSEPSDADSRREAGRPGDAAPGGRYSETRPGAESGRPGVGTRPAEGRGESTSVRGPRGFETPRVSPTVRKVSVGSPSVSQNSTVGPRGADLATNRPRAANLRSSSLGGDRETVSRGYSGRGSDAERATYGSHAGSEARREGARHARATAAYHRSSAYYHHRAAAARHHAWAAARARYYNRWYYPGGWFAPWRPGYTHWYHGVFVYGPYPWYHHDHVVYVHDGDGGGGGGQPAEERAPERKVDRARTFAVGLRGGSYLGGYEEGGGGFGDAGLGLAVRYRPVEAVGLEVSWMHHDQTWDEGTERAYQPLQASVQLFAAPWTKVNPYVLAGVTLTTRQVHDDIGFTQVDQSGFLLGPHVGIGLELGLGKKVSINGDVRYTGYLNKPQGDLTFPGAAQANLGLNFYF